MTSLSINFVAQSRRSYREPKVDSNDRTKIYKVSSHGALIVLKSLFIFTKTAERDTHKPKAKQIKLSEEQVVKALMAAQSLRPDRYTILSKIRLDNKSAFELAKSVGVI